MQTQTHPAAPSQALITSSYCKYSEAKDRIDFERANGNTGHIYAPGASFSTSTWWGVENMVDDAGREWRNGDLRFCTDDFGNLVQVAA